MLAGTATAPALELEHRPPRPDELELLCIACHQRCGAQENIVYWPPSRTRPGVIAHRRCFAKKVSL